jgi:hypothetical protein
MLRHREGDVGMNDELARIVREALEGVHERRLNLVCVVNFEAEFIAKHCELSDGFDFSFTPEQELEGALVGDLGM